MDAQRPLDLAPRVNWREYREVVYGVPGVDVWLDVAVDNREVLQAYTYATDIGKAGLDSFEWWPMDNAAFHAATTPRAVARFVRKNFAKLQ